MERNNWIVLAVVAVVLLATAFVAPQEPPVAPPTIPDPPGGAKRTRGARKGKKRLPADSAEVVGLAPSVAPLTADPGGASE